MAGRLVSSWIALALFSGGFVARGQDAKPALPAKPATAAPALPRLVLLVVVDQCRPDYFDRFAPRFEGFFHRLRDEGRWYPEGEQHHAITVTAAGHAAIGTGRFPCHNGIVENEFFDPADGKIVGAANDKSAAPVGGEGGGYSPRRLLCDGLGDWWKRRWPESHVVGISTKPRSAIFPLGRGGDAAFWVDETTGHLVTSAWYRKEPTPWVAAFNAGDTIAKLPQEWDATLGDAAAYAALGCTADDQPGEVPIDPSRPRLFPHSLASARAATRTQLLLYSPFGDDLLLEFARAAIEGEHLGEDEVPDLLVLGLSATDYVGHRYGPDSWEIAEQVIRLDHTLGEFVDRLEERTEGRLLVALTSDHGVAPLPEVAKARGGTGARVDWGSLKPVVAAALAAIAPPLEKAALQLPEYGIRLDPKLVAESGKSLEEVADALAAKLRGAPPFADARSHFELQRPLKEGDRIGELMRASSDGERAGDLLFILPRGSIYYAATATDAQMDRMAATSHGTPYDYDTHVPIVFFGLGVAAGRVAGRAWSVDIAPTLATHLQVPLPEGLDGRPLDLTR
jgi:predicted AlkP superfamily pyrophosphatase or phosphodiesterase